MNKKYNAFILEVSDDETTNEDDKVGDVNEDDVITGVVNLTLSDQGALIYYYFFCYVRLEL